MLLFLKLGTKNFNYKTVSTDGAIAEFGTEWYNTLKVVR